jgi:hypothetical protein
MKMRFRSGVFVAVLAAASILAGGSLAKPYMEHGDAAKSPSLRVAGSQGHGVAGNQSASSAVDPGASAKKGKGDCAEESDGDVSKCPPAPKKAAKKGKGYEAG